MLFAPTIEFKERVLKTGSQTLFLVVVRHFKFLSGLPLCTRSQTPGSRFPVPRSPFPVPRSPFPVLVTPVRLWSRARQRLAETDHNSFLPSKQSRLLRKRTKRNDRNWRSCRNIRKKNVKRKKQPKRKKRRTKCLGNVDFTPNSAYGIRVV